jgi:hypothetical protein
MSRMFAREQQKLEEQLPHARNEERTQLLRTTMAISRAQSSQSRIIALLCTRLKLVHYKAHRSSVAEQRPWDIPGDGDELQ